MSFAFAASLSAVHPFCIHGAETAPNETGRRDARSESRELAPDPLRAGAGRASRPISKRPRSRKQKRLRTMSMSPQSCAIAEKEWLLAALVAPVPPRGRSRPGGSDPIGCFDNRSSEAACLGSPLCTPGASPDYGEQEGSGASAAKHMLRSSGGRPAIAEPTIPFVLDPAHSR